jgi:hypothetical protein
VPMSSTDCTDCTDPLADDLAEQQHAAELAATKRELLETKKELADTKAQLDSVMFGIHKYADLTQELRLRLAKDAGEFIPIDIDGDSEAETGDSEAETEACMGGDTASGPSGPPPLKRGLKRGRKTKSEKIQSQLSSLAAEASLWEDDLRGGGFDQLYMYAEKTKSVMSETEKELLVLQFEELMQRARQHLNLQPKKRGPVPKGHGWRGTSKAGHLERQ